MLSNNGKLQEMGKKGRDYVVSRYQTERIHESLVSVIENDMGTERRDHVVSRYQAERIHGSLRIGSAVKHELHRQTRERVRWSSSEFRRRFDENLKQCEWLPHPDYSCFTQYDQEYYLKRKEDFLHKYRCMYAVSKTISPSRILEMGTLAGSAADAYISASPTAEYVGLDIFGKNVRHNDQTPWDPYEVAKQLFRKRLFKKVELIKVDLRTLTKLPYSSDFVVVDAAHDFENEYADLKLALTASPEFIFVDDASDETAGKPAIDRFLKYDLKDRVDFTVAVDYTGGGLVIKLKT
jgi:predicted O-methyltransferase YrrM